MIIDLHVHTSRHSACGKSTPEEMMQAARDRGLDGVVLTEHNVVWRDDEFDALRKACPGLRIFRAAEISTAEGEDMLVYGVPDIGPLSGRQPAASVVEQARRAGGASILAHPLRYHEWIAEPLLRTPPDACEAWSMNIFAYQRTPIREFSERTGCGLVAASDAHHWASLGAYAVRFDRPLRDETDLAAALRARAYAPLQDRTRLTEVDAELAERAIQARQGIDAGLDTPSIRAKIGGSLSFIDHIRTGRCPLMLDPADPAGQDRSGTPSGLAPVCLPPAP